MITSFVTALKGAGKPCLKILHKFLFVVSFAFLFGCEAGLNLTGVEATLNQPIRRTDQLLSIEVDSQGVVTVFGAAGLLLTGEYGDQAMQWSRSRLAHGLPPNFIRSTTCGDGTQVALSFSNEIWIRPPASSDWSNVAVATEEQMEDIACRGENELWVAGAYSSLYSSSDFGESWESFSADEDATFTSIQFVDESIGYAVGEFGMVLKTEDGGQDWSLLEPIGDDFYPLSVYFANPTDGWVSGVLGIIWHTRDGGESWERQRVNSHASIYGFFEAHGQIFAFGDQGAVLRLDNEQWVIQPSPEVPIHYSDGVEFADGNILLVGGFGLNVLLPVSAPTSTSQVGGAQ